MAEVTVSIRGRNYGITCDDGQEGRVRELGAYVDEKIKAMAGAGAASSDAQLLVLTSILLADEVFEARDNQGDASTAAANSHPSEVDEQVLQTVENLASRVNTISERLQGA